MCFLSIWSHLSIDLRKILGIKVNLAKRKEYNKKIEKGIESDYSWSGGKELKRAFDEPLDPQPLLPHFIFSRKHPILASNLVHHLGLFPYQYNYVSLKTI